MRGTLTTSLVCLALAGGCGTFASRGGPPVDVGLTAPMQATEVAVGLMNPSSVDVGADGRLTICDTGNGRVVSVSPDGGPVAITADYPMALAEGFTTEYWKVDPETGAERFKLGPLSAVWLPDGQLAVTDAGLKDGAEVVQFFSRDGLPSIGGNSFPLVWRPEFGQPSNPIPPTTDDAADNGEGNLSGMEVSRDGRYLWVCGQGSDAKTWVLRCTVATRELVTFASADDWGLAVNSPMQCRVKDDGNVLVLYSGAGGKEDGTIAEWDDETGELVASWTLPGLFDPMGMDFVPGGGGELAVVDNNWALTEVKQGRLARVSLPAGGGEAKVTMLGTKFRGPVACEFGPDGRLYVCELGEAFDSDKGRVLAVSGW